MTRFMLSNNYFRPNHQKGFLPGISGCLEHNTLLSESLKDARKSERQITVCWIDLENAFGSIQHELMLFALRWYNFPPLVRDMIASYYSKLRFSIITKEGPSKAFADDLAILTRNPKHCQVLMKWICKWTDGLRTKPSKCHCLCLGRRNTRYTSYDPGLSLGGQCISTVTENAPFKFLGRKIDNIGCTPSLEGIVDSFLNDLNKAVGTAKHLLVGCKVLLDSGQYSRRHDRVLEVIREAVSLSVARAQKEITTNERSVGFVREGTRATKSNVKPYSILKAASDWTIMMDTYEKQYKIPEDICASASRPDIFLFSRILKRVVMIELTVPWETNIPKDHTPKVNKYYELTNELTRNRFVVDLYAVEVGARGITAKSIYNLLKGLGLSRTHINAFLDRISKAALVGSFQIWLGRERSLDSGGERITREK
ncbi:unnamed protein product [Danaus chrysippus]|uniref:(African queen) hypothetical protein n=1 Tax=Danaus chrysippus TaxID=151541 RepID=A0A8J2M921_9NEOP|nr:unnamed protein product [Danaus chrysippus]